MATIDPTTRTHKSNTDICWNILDIIDDYVNFDYLNKNMDLRQAMYDELTAYINTLHQIDIDFIKPTDKVDSPELTVSADVIANVANAGDMTVL